MSSLPPTDEHGRFLPQYQDGSIIKRLGAKFVDAILTGATSLAFIKLLPMPWPSVIGVGWFLLTDWFGSPGKWLFRLKTIMVNGGEVTPLASLKRNFLLGVPTIARAVVISGWWGSDADAANLDRFGIACIGLSVTTGEIIAMVMQPQNRRWGDTFAGTRVVER